MTCWSLSLVQPVMWGSEREGEIAQDPATPTRGLTPHGQVAALHLSGALAAPLQAQIDVAPLIHLRSRARQSILHDVAGDQASFFREALPHQCRDRELTHHAPPRRRHEHPGVVIWGGDSVSVSALHGV